MNIRRIWALLRFTLTTLFLFVVWVLFTADAKGLSLLFGLFASLLTSALTYHIFLPEHEGNLRFFIPRFWYLIRFLFLMIVSLYVSSFQVVKSVMSKNTNPRIVHFRTRLRSDLARTVLANCITFTPGTLTLDLNDDHLTVHWLLCTTTHAKAAGEAIKTKLEHTLGRTWL
ncbi:MAG: cation:proton antiporter [Spirochaetia bacterium]|nr:cation:proton antiporter [Spirochaetia bacterium]